MEQPVSFGTTDYVIMILMLTFSLAIGFYFAIVGRKNTTQEEYLLGGRNLRVFPVTLSLFATFNSAVSLLGIPAEVYTHGTMGMYLTLGFGMATIVCSITILPLIYPLRITSIFEYLQLRFESKLVRTIGACLGMLQTIFYMTIALLSPALALQTAANLPLWLSLIAVGAVGTIYTAIGGMKSVVWTDAFQSVIIFGGIIATIVKGCVDVGGFQNVWALTESRGRLIFDETSFDPRVRHTVWGCFIAITVNWMTAFYGQSFSQRLCATETIDHARRVIFLVSPINVIYGLILVATGMTIVAYFDHVGCDPMAAGYVTNANQLMPYFVIRTLGFIPGLAGLYISTIFSGALSTLSSGINALTANTVEDLLHPVLRKFRESTVTGISKFIVVLYGVTTIGLAYMIKEVQGPMTQITVVAMGATGGPTLGMFSLGAIFPQGNYVGASIGCLAGLAFCLWLNVAKFTYGARTPTLPLGPTDTCQVHPSLADAGDGFFNEMLLRDDSPFFNRSLNATGNNGTVSSLVVTPSPAKPIDSDNIFGETFHLYDISYLWVPVLGFLISLFLGLIISKIYELVSGVRKRPKPEYIYPFMRRIWYKDDELVSKKDKELEDRFILDEKLLESDCHVSA